MSRTPAPIVTQQRLRIRPGLVAGTILLLGFLLRLWKASGTFFNLDEAMHSLAANQPSLAGAYRASLELAHPPLLILLLNVWRRMGTSELVLRLPSVIAGTIFCWIFFKWLTRLLGPAAGWVGLVLVNFLPPLVELSSEVRQYALLLCFLIAAAYVLELALEENSAGKMLLFFFFLYLAMLTHFSAILFAGSVGIYSLWRLFSARRSRRFVATWMAGQAGALALLIYLYRTQIGALKDSAAAGHMHVFLANSYFHWSRDHLLLFVFARTFGVLQYTFGQLAVGDIAGVLLVAGVTLLLRQEPAPEQAGPSPRQLGIFLALPFVINCLTAIMGLYPYGGTRHSAFLLPFAVAGVSYVMAKLAGQSFSLALSSAILIVAVCQMFGVPHRPFMRREDQRIANMTQAINALRQQISPADPIFVDFHTNFLLRFYLCPGADPGNIPPSGFQQYRCDGYRVISTGSDKGILTSDIFATRWNDMLRAYSLIPGQTVWIFQAGWDTGLARGLQQNGREFHDLNWQCFGRNISLFKLTAAPG